MIAFVEEHQSFPFPILYPFPCLSKGLWGGSIFLKKISLDDFPAKKKMLLILKDIVLQMSVLN